LPNCLRFESPRIRQLSRKLMVEVSFGKELKGKRRVLVTPEYGEPRNISLPKAKHIIVHEGDYVQAGEALMEGTVVPNDILRVLGVKELAKFLVNEIQEVYRLQGVKINDKHIEVIVRQMLRRVHDHLRWRFQVHDRRAGGVVEV
jgi:DNA-directed RNA polymerase subunit beta'